MLGYRGGPQQPLHVLSTAWQSGFGTLHDSIMKVRTQRPQWYEIKRVGGCTLSIIHQLGQQRTWQQENNSTSTLIVPNVEVKPYCTILPRVWMTA
jgi:hypothetical protein